MTPPDLLFAEDIVVGSSMGLGEFDLTQEAIVGFSRQWDPQTFHIDEDLARAHYFGGVVASGAHLIAVFQRLAALAVYRHWHVYAGRSLTDIRFLSPVRGGVRLRGQMTITEVEMTHPARALVTQTGVLYGESEPVLDLTAQLYVYRQ